MVWLLILATTVWLILTVILAVLLRKNASLFRDLKETQSQSFAPEQVEAQEPAPEENHGCVTQIGRFHGSP